MKHIDESPEQVAQEVIIPAKTEKKFSKPTRLPKGMLVWECDWTNGNCVPVQYKMSEIIKDAQGGHIRHHIEYRKDRYYCMAINFKNAQRKLVKWIKANQNLKAMMAMAAAKKARATD